MHKFTKDLLRIWGITFKNIFLPIYISCIYHLVKI
jgi:hypothetical protein